MNQQGELWETFQPETFRDRLFIGILPDKETARQIHELAIGLCNRHGLIGPGISIDHFHITLRWIDDYPKLSENDVEGASAACEAAAANIAPFNVCLNRVISWGRNPGKSHLVMLGDADSNDRILKCRRVLLKELVKKRCPGQGSPTSTPHLTLRYGNSNIPEEAVPPVIWTVNDIVLIHNEIGPGSYIELGRWKLRG